MDSYCDGVLWEITDDNLVALDQLEGYPYHYTRFSVVVNTDRGLLVPFAVWGVIMATGNAVAMALNGLAVVRMQVIVASTMAVTNLILSISLAHVFGAAGVLWGSVIAYLGCVGLPYARFVARLGRLESP